MVLTSGERYLRPRLAGNLYSVKTAIQQVKIQTSVVKKNLEIIRAIFSKS